jgi:DNA-binding transcriptional regulator YiaG
MYHYRECGLRNVWLANGYEVRETPYGKGISINDIPGLHRAIGRSLICKGGKLTGTELRFLRTELGLSQAKLAEALGNEAQTVALWEKKGSQPRMADRFVRALYREQMEGNAHIMQMLERLIDSDVDQDEERLTMQQDHGAWKVAA